MQRSSKPHGTKEVQMPNTRDAISAANEALAEAIRAGDAAAGRDAIQAFWQGVIDMGAKDATLETAGLLDFGDTQIERGGYTLTVGSDDGDVTDEGKYLVVWKRDGEAWRLLWDSFSSDLPA
jgi:ketosteroid isomerase-like protein